MPTTVTSGVDGRGGAGQEIRFVRAADRVRIAAAMHGQGRPLVSVACWLSHLQFDWESPVWRHLLVDLGSFTTLVRYDERGCGLSDWDVDDLSLEARVRDLEAVVDQLGFARCALLGLSQGGAVAITYASRHRERVSHLVLSGAFARGTLAAHPSPGTLVEFETLMNLTRIGWARDNPVFRRVFTNMFIPEATSMQVSWFDDLQRMSTSTDNAVRMRLEWARTDVAVLLPRLRVPTLVLHAVHEQVVSFGEGRRIARAVPGARFVPLATRNHILLANEPAWAHFVAEVRVFLATDAALEGRGAPLDVGLSVRELEVLRLASDGRTNAEIAAAVARVVTSQGGRPAG